jgi:hypothetical protein
MGSTSISCSASHSSSEEEMEMVDVGESGRGVSESGGRYLLCLLDWKWRTYFEEDFVFEEVRGGKGI